MIKLLTFSTRADELEPMVAWLRKLYYGRAVDGMSIILTEEEFALEANPFVHRYYQEFATTEPLHPDDEWLWQAARRAVLEERPQVVGVPGLYGIYTRLVEMCQAMGVATLVGHLSDAEEAARVAPAAIREPWEGLESLVRPWWDRIRALLPDSGCRVEGVQVPWSTDSPTVLKVGVLGRSADPGECLRQALAEDWSESVWIEPVNLPVSGARHTFRYGGYDNEFALGPASCDLQALCREMLPAGTWRATVVNPRNGCAIPRNGRATLEAPDSQALLLALRITRHSRPPGTWWDQFRVPDSLRLKVVVADSGNIAGSVLNFGLCINRYTPHEALALTTKRHPFIDFAEARAEYLTGPPRPEVKQFLEQADGFVFFEDDDEASPNWPVDLRPYVEGKPVVHIYIGFRAHKDIVRLQRPGRTVLTPLPHLLRMYPEARFYSGPYPATLEDIELTPPLSASDGVVRVLQTYGLPERTASRNYFHKNTEAYMAAARRLKRKFPQVEFWQMCAQPHHQVLQARQQCDITFNHLRGHISMAGGEAMYLERVLVHDFDQFSINRHLELWGMDVEFPWVTTGPDRLEEALEGLILDPARRAELGRAGREFMRGHFSPQVGIQPLIWHLHHARPVTCG